jgi:hypothetical protein
MEVGADDNQRIMTSDRSLEEAGHNAIISRPFRFPFNYGIVTMRGKESDQLRQLAAIPYPSHVAQSGPSHL